MALQDLPHEQAAEQLISADAMLAACPRLESAKCARVEVNSHCCSNAFLIKGPEAASQLLIIPNWHPSLNWLSHPRIALLD